MPKSESAACPRAPDGASCAAMPTREPHWRPAERFTNAELPAVHRRWLLDDGSLTGRLIELDAGSFGVRRLYQGWSVPRLSERRLLNLPARQTAIVREVLLTLDNRAVVFARSVLPVAILQGRLAHLRRLQNKPLGAILFRDPGMQRSPFELARLPGDSGYLPRELWQPQALWGRRSCFRLRGHDLMVSEVFLPGFTPWEAILPVHRTQRGKVSAAILHRDVGD
ncbi:chorismate--pyruvate lyase family protein [Haliea sp. E17]|uniref:chorismate--pyruvate lyase family protein n=1 Tax=Haliea sp. E17 TaxID=3401576 RepID=UPI003AAA351E